MSDLEYTEILAANNKVYDAEAILALELGEAIPILAVEQDLRSKNRFREHSTPHCELTNLGNVSQRHPNHNLFVCKCGWTGWLIPKKEDL